MPSDENKNGKLGREQTDDSLKQERQRTNAELVKNTADIASRADEVVAESRDRADSNVRGARRSVDTRLRRAPDSAREGIEEERRREDHSVEEERTVADRKLHEERIDRAKVIGELLRLERDDTDRNLLLERGRSDKAIHARDDFLGMVSHDLRTLLSGISMTAALLEQTADQDMPGRTREAAARIQRFAVRMNRLIGDLVDIASIESGKLLLITQPHDATRLIRDSRETFDPIAAAKRISVALHVTKDSLLAKCDHERILQVLANLLSNAIKFTPEGGSIAMRVERADAMIRFSVQDTGSGIADSDFSAIFKRFWQVKTADRRGLGLGLYISKCIVELHGGNIWVDSQVGRGSTFIFTLPAFDP